MAEQLAALIRKVRAAGLLAASESEPDGFEYAVYLEGGMMHYIKADEKDALGIAHRRFEQANRDYPGALVELKRRPDPYIGRPAANPTRWTTFFDNGDF